MQIPVAYVVHCVEFYSSFFPLQVHGDLPSPLKWNAERTWTFDIIFRQPVFYLLRDHINMFTDLGKDWASGPPSDWQRWVPTVYLVNLRLYYYEINAYANDQNIIDKPLVREDNGILANIVSLGNTVLMFD